MKDEVKLYVAPQLTTNDVILQALDAAGVKLVGGRAPIFGVGWVDQHHAIVRNITALGIMAIVRESGIPVKIEAAHHGDGTLAYAIISL